MDIPIHAVITSFLSTTKDRFHQYNPTKTLDERLQMASEMDGISGVEMVFPLHSPSIDKIKIVKKGDVRRAKLYYLKRKVGKETKVEEKITHSEEADVTPPAREEAK